MKSAFIAAFVLCCASWAHAQTVTTINAAGFTVVQILTTNPLGLATTQILQTITGPVLQNTLVSTTTTSTSSTTPLQTIATTSTTQQQGAVEQPAATTVLTPGGPTPYTYTTTNGVGQTVVVEATFTPTVPATVLPIATTTGTILNYSSYMSMIGTTTTTASGGCRRAFSLSSSWYGLGASMALGIGGGAWFVL